MTSSFRAKRAFVSVLLFDIVKYFLPAVCYSLGKSLTILLDQMRHLMPLNPQMWVFIVPPTERFRYLLIRRIYKLPRLVFLTGCVSG